MAGKSKAKKKAKGAAKAAPLTSRKLTITMAVPAKYADRIEALFEEAVAVLEDRIAGQCVEAVIGKPGKAKEA